MEIVQSVNQPVGRLPLLHNDGVRAVLLFQSLLLDSPN